MAVPVVASHTSTAVDSGSTTTTLSQPASLAAGELLVCFAGCRDGTDTGQALSGWNTAVTNTDTNSKAWGACYWREATSGDVSSWSHTISHSPAANTSSCVVLRITGANVSSPIDVTGSDPNGDTNTTSPIAPSVTTTGSNRLVLRYLVAFRNNAADISNSSGTLIVETEVPSAGASQRHGTSTCSETQASAGATGTFGWTTSNRECLGITVAIAEAAGGVTNNARQLINGGLIGQNLLGEGLIG